MRRREHENLSNEVWIWTDVDGIMTADPGLIPRARSDPDISYTEVYELAYFGAKVLHPKTILPAGEAKLPLWVKNTINPVCKGTRISQCLVSDKYDVSAVAGIFNIGLLTAQIMPGRDITKTKIQINDPLISPIPQPVLKHLSAV